MAKANNHDIRLEEIETELESVASGSPLVASSLSDMTETDRIYVLTTNGHWYWYNGSSWQDGGIYQASEDSDTLNNLADEVENFTNGKILNYDERNVIHRYIGSDNKITSIDTAKTAVFELKNGKHYKIIIKGSYNRFFSGLTNSLDIGSSCVSLARYTYGIPYYEYEFDNTDNYKYLLVTYAIGNSYLDFIKLIEENINPLYVNGVNVITNENINNRLKLNIKTDNYNINDLILGNCSADSLHEWEISSNSRSLVLKTEKNKHYKINVKGNFNRFWIWGYDFSQEHKGGNLISSASGSFTEKEIDYLNTLYDAISITLGYNIPENYDIESIAVTEYTGDLNVLEIEGFKFQSGNENNDFLKYLQYISPSNIELVPTVNGVYNLYDNLLNEYPYYINKNLLGQNSQGTNIYEYVFTSGNYNQIHGQRPYNSVKNKDKILIITGVHGYERTSVMGLYQFIKDLCENNPILYSVRENYEIKIIPIVTPWAYNNNSRVNENGVNINRNFNINWTPQPEGQDYGGESPADQLETQIVQNWINNNRDAVLYIDYHNSGYANEVSYLSSNNQSIKDIFLKNMSSMDSYWINEEDFSHDLIFQYTGNPATSLTSEAYANSKGLNGCLLESSWNQNNTGKDSSISIKTNAEVIGNILLGLWNSNN